MAKFLKDNGVSKTPVNLALRTLQANKAVSRGKGVLYNKTAPVLLLTIFLRKTVSSDG